MANTPGTVRFPANLDDADSLINAVNNLAQTTVSDNPLTSGATTINCASTTGYPATGILTIESEIVTYTGKTSTSFTGVTRGADGTAAASHVLSTPISFRMTALYHATLSAAIIAAETKLGSTADTPVSGDFLKGTGAGTSAWSALTASEINTPLNAAAANLGVGGAVGTNQSFAAYTALGVAAAAVGGDFNSTYTTQSSESVVAMRVGGTLTLAATTATTFVGLQINTATGTATAGATATTVKGIEVIGQAAITNWTPVDVWSIFANVPTTGTNKAVALFKGGNSGFGTITSDRPAAVVDIGQVATGTIPFSVHTIASSSVDAFKVDATAFDANAMVHAIDKSGHNYHTGGTPTQVLGAGAGTSPTSVSINGDDEGGWIGFTTGTSPSGSNAIVTTVTFKVARVNTPKRIIISPKSGYLASVWDGAHTFVVATAPSTTGFVVLSGGTAVSAASGALVEFYYDVQ